MPMTQTSDELLTVRLCQARARLWATMRDRLAGFGLEIRERERELVISNPRDPDKGRIHINFATGEVSLKRTIWDYLGYLQGFAITLEADPDREPVADAKTIIGALCGYGDDGGH